MLSIFSYFRMKLNKTSVSINERRMLDGINLTRNGYGLNVAMLSNDEFLKVMSRK